MFFRVDFYWLVNRGSCLNKNVRLLSYDGKYNSYMFWSVYLFVVGMGGGRKRVFSGIYWMLVYSFFIIVKFCIR